MRNITNESISAFLESRNFKKQNMEVQILSNVTILKLHNNAIAYLYNDPQKTLSITNCGWLSKTTKERLNALPNVSIQQKKGIWFLNGLQWDGNLIDIK